MSRIHCTLAALLVVVTACTDRSAITPPDDRATSPDGALGGVRVAAPRAQRPENLARLVARALADPRFRAYVKAALDASPAREHKLHFQELLDRDGQRARRAIAAANGVSANAVALEARSAMALELYLPVPAHRQAWTGDEQILVATALADREPPVAFDTRGRRTVLSPDAPPPTPVLALVPVETKFGVAADRILCAHSSCGGGGGGGGGGVQPSPSASPGLYMTKAHFEDLFEGWLKGNPEFEVHILGQKGQTDSLMSYQCAGEHAGGPYVFDQNGKDWSGSALLFSGTQLANYNAAHPGQNVRVFVVEDDDTACVIKADKQLLADVLGALDESYNGTTAGNDSSTASQRSYRRGNAFQRLIAALASLIKTNDELVGNAIEDVVVGASYPGYNWIVKGRDNATNGWLSLEMR